MRHRLFTAPAAAALVAVVAGAAAAQYVSPSSGAMFNNPVSAGIDSYISTSIMKDVMTPDWIRDASKGGGRAAAPARQAGTTSFTPGRRALLDHIPGERREQAARLLTTCDGLYRQAMARDGAITTRAELDDLSSSTTFYLELSRSICWKDQPGAPPEPQAAHLRNLRAQLRQRYLARGTFAGKSDSQKQAAHEALLLSACIPALQYLEASKKGNQAGREAARASAARLLSRFGMSRTSLRYGPGGRVAITAG
jgi:hypothetical protein